ncbi:DNA-binding NtrC family response regulator [Rhodovulum iodosum]|uniref:DNA-binding NtrC family response regulator n=1 Tax=Rhodovulum iodosum TaxID=68291 RepID=A0ABV3XS51_9RHOB|nr:response regulator [Rhodovulum robiginosum]RSK30482.1 sigma-54-dependent Fis family transcriptional regulator [Rhodovulum robiginosum]
MLGGAHIVLVEDDQILGASLAQRLEIENATVVWLRQAARALPAIRTPRAPIDAVICDIRLPDGSGEDIFVTLCQTSAPPPFLFITGRGEIEQAVRLMRAGAADYITKPFEMGVFLERLRLLIGPREDAALPALLGVSPAAREVGALIDRAAAGAGPVLVHGAPGTGKTRVARRIHALSDRAAAPLIEVNLAREPDQRAAIAAATRTLGEGIIVLVGLERIEAPAQAELLDTLRGDFAGRLVATCGPGIDSLRATGVLRADLVAALAGMTVPIPPLRDRPDDAVWLAREILTQQAGGGSDAPPVLSGLAEASLRSHDWPDNGRELRARVMQAVKLARDGTIQPADLFPERRLIQHFPTLAEAREAAERDQILAALERTGGQVGEAARALNVSRTTLWEKMQKLGL